MNTFSARMTFVANDLPYAKVSCFLAEAKVFIVQFPFYLHN